MQETLTIKISTAKKKRIQQLAQARKVSMSALLKQALDAVLTDGREGSCYDLAAKYLEDGKIGSSGIGDLSSNKKKHLKDFGRYK